MKCIVEIDLHVITCPGTFLRDYEYVYLHMEMLGLEARTKSVPPTYPLFFHERLKFERTFYDCTDPALVASLLKGEDIVIELRQHTDYITDGKVIAHCSSNTHDFLYPAIPPYYGSGREILLYKTSKFKPIRVTGEPVKLEFTTTTIIKEVPDFDTSIIHTDNGKRIVNNYGNLSKKSCLKTSSTPSAATFKKSRSTPDLTLINTDNNNNNNSSDNNNDNEFLVRRKDDKILSNRDFNTFINPKPRRSASPNRLKKSMSSTRRTAGNTTVESIPNLKFDKTMLSSTPANGRHMRSTTEPMRYTTPVGSLRYAFDDLSLSPTLRRRTRTTSPHLSAAMNSSLRIQRRVDDVIRKRDYSLDSDNESDYSLDVLRESLREERNALNDAIKQADREAYYRSLNRTLQR